MHIVLRSQWLYRHGFCNAQIEQDSLLWNITSAVQLDVSIVIMKSGRVQVSGGAWSNANDEPWNLKACTPVTPQA
jgi:hypothetical protein